MAIYKISNTKTAEQYQKEFTGETEARHWVVNTLDLSLDWSIEKTVQLNLQLNFESESELVRYCEKYRAEKEKFQAVRELY